MFVSLRKIRFLSALAAVFVALPLAAQAHDYKIGDITIDHPWARPTIGQAKNSAAFFTLKNVGEADRLIEVKSDIANRTEIHTHKMEGDVMRMRKVDDGVAVPGGQDTLFKPHGLHVMFMGVKDKLVAEDRFSLTLVFEKAGAVDVEVKVEPLRKMKAHDHSEKHDHGHKHQ